MAIKRYYASADTTITNAFKSNGIYRGVSGNMGQSDILEVFSLYDEVSTGSRELSRILIQFPISDIVQHRNSNMLPASGSVSFKLKLYNAPTNKPLATDYVLEVKAVSGSWDEGRGLDMEEYTDIDTANWLNRASSSLGTSSWVTSGGDTHASPIYTQSFTGIENLDIDVTGLVEQWISGTKNNHGFMVKMSSSIEEDDASYYTKEFFARGSQFFFKRPILEAQWNSARKDQRGSFYASSSLSDNNNNTIYLYNRIRGQLKNIPTVGTGNVYVRVYDAPTGSSLVTNTVITGGWVSTGIYTASFALNTTSSQVFDRWFNSGLSICYHTGAIDVIQQDAEDYDLTTNYVVSLINSKPFYTQDETARFRFFIRNKDWNPTIYNVATSEVETLTIESASYKLVRVSDNLKVIDYGTGSNLHTMLSYDVSGNYFDLDMNMLEPNYMYQIYLTFFDSQTNSWREQKNSFKFRVEKNEP
ncbi:MAG: Disaggregatase related repeat [Bacteroidota bacterium]|jgi:hypothetical protein